MELGDKVAIVTGAARGIGYAIASRYAREGARVMLADVDEDAGAEAADVIRDAGGNVQFVACDVAERLDIHNLVAATLEAYERVDVLVNNAAMVHAADFLELSEADFDRVMRVNLTGAFLAGQAVAREMKRQFEEDGRNGVIINMSSVNAEVAIPDQVPYVVAKGGINQLTRVMAVALARYGVRVNAIGPGSVSTGMLKAVNADDEGRARLMSRTPMGRIGSPDEIAGVAAFLASDDASYITGQCIYADGGRLALNLTVENQT
ncbi:SDR family NAD(P)-dependent oxidoreductase [Pyruvatibacter mobilis]|uniref:SDR family NAD(P)-dependent oxidoreductase n=1 Tax=Pyruvatibacter mobilis TaxID=1712261 RepID=UPI003BAA215C